MAKNIFVCKHMMGAGWCEVHEDYCVEGPCGDSEPIEYAPVVHGRWVDHMVRDWRCSECGEKIRKVRNVDGYYYDDKPNYCPNCGAKMDGEPDG